MKKLNRVTIRLPASLDDAITEAIRATNNTLGKSELIRRGIKKECENIMRTKAFFDQIDDVEPDWEMYK